MLLQGVGGLAGIVALVCFIIILVRMFQTGDTTLGIVCIVTLLCGIGVLITYIMGWVKQAQYRSFQIMLIWTACLVVGLICNFAAMAMAGQ
jgi:hypothetical protein